jgi:2-phospho-L-lactate guanylyltransferase
MRTAAILPVKRFDRAKQRLGVSVGEPLRRELARAMVGDVLLALARTESIERTIVVTREDSVVGAAHRLGALVVTDAVEEGQSAAVTLGVNVALAGGIERVLCVPGDCPALDPAELESLLADRPGRRRAGNDAGPRFQPAVIVLPDRHGTGTNGLLLTPPDVIAPSFGPDSCERHRALARAAGVACEVRRIPSLLLDIDTGEDLRALREGALADAAEPPGAGDESLQESERSEREPAARTHAVLGRPAHGGARHITTSA